MSSKKRLNLKSLVGKASIYLKKFRRYSFVLFVLFVAGLYGFVFFRINSLISTEPSDAAVASHVKAAHVPRIDKSVLGQLESLQDNSVNVKALFDEARSNPFQ